MRARWGAGTGRGRALAVLALVAALATACSGGAEDPDHPLAQHLLNAAPAGFASVVGPASGPMTIEDAAGASAVDVTVKRAFLQRSGFQGGYSRVWEHGADYVTLLAHEFATERSAIRFVEFELEQVSAKQGTATFSVPEIPGSNGYILSGVKRKGLDPVFCQSVWFPIGSRVYAIQTCGAQPAAPTLATDLARDQYDLVAEA